jgi:hypothetical protein
MLNRTFFLRSYLFKVKNSMFMDAPLRFGAALAEHGSVRRGNAALALQREPLPRRRLWGGLLNIMLVM